MVAGKILGILSGGGLSWGVLVCTLVGAYGVLQFLREALSLIYRYCIRGRVNLKKYGEWVVITGATDGIGKAYSEQMASKGMNVFIISRTESKLDELAKELETKYDVQTKRLAVDFSKVSKESWSEIRGEMVKIDVGILINNVGCSYEHYEYFHSISDETVDNLIEINIRATTEMTRCVLPSMVERRRGLVICIGSGVGSLLPSSPLLAAYAGSKAYVEQFVRSLSLEYKKYNISFQDQAPLFVASKMSKIRRASMSIPSPKTWVGSAMKGIDSEVVTAGYWYHCIMWMIMKRLPSIILDNYVTKQAENLRARALKKKAKSQ